MSDLLPAFERAQDEVLQLREPPDVPTKLRLYALFKQAKSGDAKGERPPAAQFVAQAKFDAWHKLAGMDRETAMQGYIDLVTDLKSLDE